MVPYDSCTVLQLQNNNLDVIAGDGFENWEEIKKLSFSLDEQDFPSTLVVETQQSVIVNDVSTYPSFQHEEILPAQIKSWMGVPLIADGQPVGIIGLDKSQTAFFNQRHAHIAQAFASQAAIALKNAQRDANADLGVA